MSYQLYLETDETFRVGCGEWEHFADAKTQIERMITDLLGRQKGFDCGCWDEFKTEFPEDIRAIIESFEHIGSANGLSEDILGDTENYHYDVSDEAFHIYESENAEYAPTYALQTNMLSMTGEKSNYYFRCWCDAAGVEEVMIIRLEKDDTGINRL